MKKSESEALKAALHSNYEFKGMRGYAYATPSCIIELTTTSHQEFSFRVKEWPQRTMRQNASFVKTFVWDNCKRPQDAFFAKHVNTAFRLWGKILRKRIEIIVSAKNKEKHNV